MARPITDETAPLDKLGSLLPSEVTGLYVSLRALFLAPGIAHQDYWIVGCGVVSLIFGLLYIRLVRKVTNGFHLLIYAFLFVNWALTLDVAQFQDLVPKDVPLTNIVAGVSLVLSIAVPVFVPSQTVASTPKPGSAG